MKKQPAATQPNTEGATDHIQRCAVCKVDLKGRFVYADAEFETLIGLSQDDLFGRPLTDFTPEPEHEIVNNLLVQHSQYESIHEAARLHLIDADGLRRPVAMITALNFVAGNAVNFQVVFHTLEAQPITPAAQVEPHELDSILALLSASLDTIHWPDFVGLLQSLASARECLVYRIDGENLVLAATSADPAAGEDAVTISAATDDLHWWLSQSGERYRFDNSDHVQSALEAVAEAPTELIVPIAVDPGKRYLVRCVYDADPDTPSAPLAASLDRVETVLNLLAKTLPSESTGQEAALKVADLPTVADQLSVGVCELKNDDSLGPVNRTLAARAKCDSFASLKDLLAALTMEGDTVGRKMITDAIRLCRTASQQATCSVRVTGSDDSTLTLTVLREQDRADSSLWLCLQPCRHGSVGAAMSRAAILRLLDHLHQLLKVAGESATPLTHVAFADVAPTQKLQLVTLTDSLQQAGEMVSQLQHIASSAGRPRKLQDVNLNMLVGQVFERLRREPDAVTLNLACGDLPVIYSACAELETALFCMARVMVSGESGESCQVRIDAELTDTEVRITFAGKAVNSGGSSLLDRLNGSGTRSDSRLFHDQLALAVVLDSLQGRVEAVAGNDQAVQLIIPRS